MDYELVELDSSLDEDGHFKECIVCYRDEDGILKKEGYSGSKKQCLRYIQIAQAEFDSSHCRYNRAISCGGEDCICCGVYHEIQADQRASERDCCYDSDDFDIDDYFSH